MTRSETRLRTALVLAVGITLGLLLAGTPALAAGGDLAAKALSIAKKADKRSKTALDMAAEPGPAGPAGPAGAAAPPPPPAYVARTTGSVKLTSQSQPPPRTVVVTLPLPTGSYVVSAGGYVSGTGRVTCQLLGTGVTSDFVGVATNDQVDLMPLYLSGTVIVATSVELSCSTGIGAPSVINASVTAVPVSGIVTAP